MKNNTLLLFLLTAAPFGNAAPFGQHGDEASAPRQYAPDRQFQVHHLALDVTPDFRQRSVSGTAHDYLPAHRSSRSTD